MALDDCILWTGAKNRGYGWKKVGGKTYLAHRLAYCLANDIPIEWLSREQCVMHRCDNPACVNPAHLVLGTHADNMADMARKRRAPHYKLTQEQADEARSLRSAGATIRALANRFGVSYEAMRRLLNHKTYRKGETHLGTGHHFAQNLETPQGLRGVTPPGP